MKILNKTKNRTIAKEVDVADSFFKKVKGLMFSRKFQKPLLIVFSREARKINAIHSLFVFFKFDAVFLNNKKIVVDIRKVKPFTPLITPRKPTKYLIELKEGEADKMRINIGDRVVFCN
jgi:hypothetical protein